MVQETPIQEAFLKTLKENGTPVAVFLINGIKLLGHIADYDDEVVMLKNISTQIVFKHAISTICNSQPVTVNTSEQAA